MKTIIERVKAPETKFGKFILWITGVIPLVLSGFGYCLEYIHIIPQDWISPGWKKWIVACAILSVVWGKLTKDPKYSKPTPPQNP